MAPGKRKRKIKRKLNFIIIIGRGIFQKTVGGIEKIFGGTADGVELLPIGMRQGMGKDDGGRVDDFANRGFEFEGEPEEKIGFVGSDLEAVLTDKPGQGGDKNKGK